MCIIKVHIEISIALFTCVNGNFSDPIFCESTICGYRFMCHKSYCEWVYELSTANDQI